MIKKIKSLIKLQISARMANPSPPVGPALGQRGVNIMEFCKLFNKKTELMEKGLLIPTIITVYSDRSFNFIIKSPPASVLIKKIIGIKKGSNKPKTEQIGFISKIQLLEIAKIKSNDMTGNNINNIIKSIEGTAKSMGVLIKD